MQDKGKYQDFMSFQLKIVDGKGKEGYEDRVMKEFCLKNGVYFWVLMFDNYVIKVPRQENKDRFPRPLKEQATREGVKRICELQNEVYKKFPQYTIPVYQFDNLMVSPIPKGTLGYLCKHPHLKERMIKIKEEIKKGGYDLGDIEQGANYFYDEENDKLTIIDYGDIQKI